MAIEDTGPSIVPTEQDLASAIGALARLVGFVAEGVAQTGALDHAGSQKHVSAAIDDLGQALAAIGEFDTARDTLQRAKNRALNNIHVTRFHEKGR